MVCKNCGKKIENGSDTCPFCGKPVKASDTAGKDKDFADIMNSLFPGNEFKSNDSEYNNYN